MSYLELLQLAAPETIIVVAAFAVLAADLFALRELELPFRRIIGGVVSCVGGGAAVGWMLALPQHASVGEGMFVVDPVSQWVKIALLALTILAVLISLESEF